MRSFTLLASLVCFIACIQGHAPVAQVTIPDGWQKINAEEHFTFHLPKSMALSSRERCVECVWGSTFSDDRIRLSAEYTSWNEEYVPGYLAKQPEYSKEMTEVDGKKAKIQSWWSEDSAGRMGFIAEVRFYGSNGRLVARMSALCKERGDVETAKQIFTTVDFLR